jgi:hypothetical protein
MNHDPCLPAYDTASGATGGVTEQSKDGKHMKGIQFVVDDRGEKTAVLINLQEHGDLWEDFYDCLIARARADEPRESLAEVREQLRQQGKLHG